MPPWPFSSGTSPDTTTPATRLPSSLDRYAQTPPEQSPTGFDPYNSPASNLVHQSHINSAPTSPKHNHGRSLSGTLPSLFGGAKKKSTNTDDTVSKSSPTTQDGHRGAAFPRKMAPKPTADDGEVEVGSCATCGTKVKWPKGIPQYRCNTCLMVNDLRPLQRQPERTEDRLPLRRNGSGRGIEWSSSEVSPLKADRTKAIISSCIETYLKSRRPGPTDPLSRETNTPPRSPLRTFNHINERTMISDDPKPHPSQQSPTRQNSSLDDPNSPTNRKRLGFVLLDGGVTIGGEHFTNSEDGAGKSPQTRKSLPSSTEQQPVRDPDRALRPTRKPVPPPMNLPPRGRVDAIRSAPLRSPNSSDETRVRIDSKSPSPIRREEGAESKAIFRAIEDDLIRTFGNQQCLNKSFLLARPIPRGAVKSEDHIPRHRSVSDVEGMKTIDGSMSELDAKTLLLGDVAENGLWWTGRDARVNSSVLANKPDRSDTSIENMVHSRSPCINFAELSRWYTMVIGAGENWQQHHSLQDGSLEPFNDTEVNEINAAFSNARLHIQRTLLKISEVILKRPGKPLKIPNDIRFLLILLANPLLDAKKAGAITTESKKKTEVPISPLPSDQKVKSDKEERRIEDINSSWDQSHAFGVLKRILGLLSNLSNECHRNLTLWFARYNDKQFRRLVDLIQSFITYRLGRQNHQKQGHGKVEPGLIPGLAGASAETSAQLHAALGLPSQPRTVVESSKYPPYSSDWQIKAAARVMALLFSANKVYHGDISIEQRAKHARGQPVPTSDFYNTIVDLSDLIVDFDIWESGQGRFAFCQYPFLLSVGAKIRIMEHDARRQMEIKAREAFFNSILRNKTMEQYLTLKVRRECLVEDSLKGISEVVGAGQQEIKKGLKLQFVDEEGVDAGGLRKEWFLLLVREIFEPQHGLFVYDEDSHLCYFNPHSFETSDQYFLVGALLGLAIYNSTILDVALPPFTFKKLLASGSVSNNQKTPFNRMPIQYTLDDLAEYRPALAKGFRQVLEYDGDVETNLCLDFVAEVDRYGSKTQVPLCPDGEKKPVTNANRQEFVDLYVRYLLDTQVSRQFEPFKRGFFTVCGGNALSLFQPEEIELLIRGSDEPLDVPSLKAVAVYENWRRGERQVEDPAEHVNLIRWFWEFFEGADPRDQRKLLGFITGSDRIPAAGAASLVIKVAFAGKDYARFPIARTCFNLLLLYRYRSKEELVEKLWRAVTESEGFGLK